MSGGNRCSEIGQKNISIDDIKLLARRARAGDAQARETLILKHLYLVDRLRAKFSGKGVPDEVLYQEGCYGLILGINKYNPDRGASLATYVSYYIDKYLHLAMIENQPHPIMLKYKATKYAREYKDAIDTLQSKIGRMPSVQEIADYLGLSYGQVTNIMNGTSQVLAYDDLFALPYIPVDACIPDAESITIENLNEMCLDQFPVVLTRREKTVLELRFGFGKKGRPHSFIEIGEIMKICDDTAAKICQEALQKLRDSINESEDTTTLQ